MVGKCQIYIGNAKNVISDADSLKKNKMETKMDIEFSKKLKIDVHLFFSQNENAELDGFVIALVEEFDHNVLTVITKGLSKECQTTAVGGITGNGEGEVYI